MAQAKKEDNEDFRDMKWDASCMHGMGTFKYGSTRAGVARSVLSIVELVTVGHSKPPNPKVASPGTFPELLRRSRFASFDPTIRQSYGTPPSRLHRGNWGLKRPIAQSKRSAFKF